ncbi:MAG: hypothetical protein AB1798_13680, partial [Spirochaetota bacterium]
EFRTSITTITSKMNNFLEILENFQKEFMEIRSTFQGNTVSVNETTENLAMISSAIKEQNEALTDGLKSLEIIFNSSREAEAVVSSLLKAHDALDNLLNRRA